MGDTNPLLPQEQESPRSTNLFEENISQYALDVLPRF